MNTTHTQTQPALYTWASDPGHAWLIVNMDELRELGITSRISSYSYHNNGLAYLEEDCDAPIFIEAMRNRGVTIEFRGAHVNHDSVIRTYRRFP